MRNKRIKKEYKKAFQSHRKKKKKEYNKSKLLLKKEKEKKKLQNQIFYPYIIIQLDVYNFTLYMSEGCGGCARSGLQVGIMILWLLDFLLLMMETYGDQFFTAQKLTREQQRENMCGTENMA